MLEILRTEHYVEDYRVFAGLGRVPIAPAEESPGSRDADHGEEQQRQKVDWFHERSFLQELVLLRGRGEIARSGTTCDGFTTTSSKSV